MLEKHEGKEFQMRKETVGIGTHTTSKNGDRKNMQPIRIEE